MRQKNQFGFSLLFAALLSTVIPNLSAEEEIVVDEASLFGESDDGSEDANLEDSLFGTDGNGGDGLITVTESIQDLDSILLVSDMVEIGGQYHFSGQSTWTWDDPGTLLENLGSPTIDTAGVDLGATLFFDARPAEELRVFGKATVSYPFGSVDGGGSSDFSEIFSVDELFSDFGWRDLLYFRGGKHTVNWGIGYFFSPADLLNVTEIDPENPEAEREGPLSLKAQLPLDNHNLYLYILASDIDEWRDFGVAGRVELVLGSMELGVGALYQRDVSPSAMLTVSLPLWDIDFFGELVARFGSDRTFVEETVAFPGVGARHYDDRFFFHATAGFSFLYMAEEVDSSISLTAQYLFNGEGYRDPSILAGNPVGIAALISAGDLSYQDLQSTGMHYLAGSAGWSGIAGTNFGVRAFWIHNASDSSGYVSPTISTPLFDQMSLSFGTPIVYGESGDEYSPGGTTVSLQIGLTMGSGRF